MHPLTSDTGVVLNIFLVSKAGRQRTGSVVYSDASLAAVAASFLMNIGANEVNFARCRQAYLHHLLEHCRWQTRITDVAISC